MKRYTVKWTTTFKKDYKSAKKRGLDINLLKEVVLMLSENTPLPAKFRDHSLHGDWIGYRECHIQPNWLLLYRVEDDTLVLTLFRTGTHSDIF